MLECLTHLTIFHKLLLTALLPALLVVVLTSALIYLNLQRGFIGYIESLESARLDPAVARLAEMYEQDGDFEALRENPRRWGAIISREGERPREFKPDQKAARRGPPRRSIDPLELPPRVTLYDADGRRLFGAGDLDGDAIHKPIVVDGTRVGTLGVRPIEHLEDQLEIDYLTGQRRTLAGIAALALALATLVALVFARSLAASIRSLANGARCLAQGAYNTRIERKSADELGALARDFNELAMALEAAERARRRWVADTSHELRTPLTVIQGNIEAMQDGIRPLDQANLALVHEEFVQLNRLVDDLALLANADRGDLSYQLSTTDLRELVEAVAAQHRLQLEGAGLELEFELEPSVMLTRADPLRLTQLLGNLLENSRCYTESPGRVRVRLWTEPAGLHLVIEDSAPSVDEADLPKLFERFYRPDGARSRARGGSGLGLSICARIAEAHAGEIWAERSDLGGLAVHLRLPAHN